MPLELDELEVLLLVDDELEVLLDDAPSDFGFAEA